LIGAQSSDSDAMSVRQLVNDAGVRASAGECCGGACLRWGMLRRCGSHSGDSCSRPFERPSGCVAASPEGDPYRSYVMIGMIRIATMLATLIIGLIAGP